MSPTVYRQPFKPKPMISPPNETKQESTLFVPGQTQGVVSIYFEPNFDINSLNPQVGDIFRFYIPNKYFLYSYQPLSDRKVYGFTHYSPNSDIAVMSAHFGCLFQKHTRKPRPKSDINTVRNAFEISGCTESEYHKREDVISFPQDSLVKGVLVTICIDQPLEHYISFNRNGIRSREFSSPTTFSMRISHFYLVTIFDEMPQCVSPESFVRGRYIIPKILSVESYGVTLSYDANFLQSFVSRMNIAQGLFNTYRIVLNNNKHKRELCLVTNTILKISDIDFPKYKYVDLWKRNDIPGEDIIQFDLNQLKFLDKGLRVGNEHFELVSSIVLINIMKIVKRGKKDQVSDN